MMLSLSAPACVCIWLAYSMKYLVTILNCYAYFKIIKFYNIKLSFLYITLSESRVKNYLYIYALSVYIYIYIYIEFTLCEFFKPVLTGGFSLESERQQIFSGLLGSSQDSYRS